MLELEPGTSLEAVKGAYRELIKIWHPDRFPNDPKFQKRGSEKPRPSTRLIRKSPLILLAIIPSHVRVPDVPRKKRREQRRQQSQGNAKNQRGGLERQRKLMNVRKRG